MIKIQQILSVMETLCLIVFIILAGIFYMIITLIGDMINFYLRKFRDKRMKMIPSKKGEII